MSTVYSALWPIQQAFAQVLTADATLIGLLAKDIDNSTRPAIFGGMVSENQKTPFLILGDDSQEAPINTFDGTSFQDEFRLHVWTGAESLSNGPIFQILASLNRLLHRQTLPLVDGLTVLHCFLAPGGAQGPLPDPDGFSKHLIVPYRIYAG